MTQSPGVLRRRIILEASDYGAIAGVEDDFHHFTASITHDGAQVTSVRGQAIRTPWTTCPEATEKLHELVGLPVRPGIIRHEDKLDRHSHCTHLMELALLAIAQAARGGGRQYDVTLPDPSGSNSRRLELQRDGQLFLAWEMNGDRIESPEPFAGQNIRNLGLWAAKHCDDEVFEAVKIMRRCSLVAIGRITTGEPKRAADFPSRLGACYAFQASRVQRGLPTENKALNFSNLPEKLLKSMR